MRTSFGLGKHPARDSTMSGDVVGFLDKQSGGKTSSSRARRLSTSLHVGNVLAKWDTRFFVIRSGSSVLS